MTLPMPAEGYCCGIAAWSWLVDLTGGPQPKNSVCAPGEPPPATADDPPGDVLALADAEPLPD